MMTFKQFNESMIDQAKSIATFRHFYQHRKYNNEPYINHPTRVSILVSKYTKDVDLIAAAWLHDTLEDTEASMKELVDAFNPRVAKIVKELTQDTTKVKQLGKADYLLKAMMKMSPEALLIKLCDRLDNVNDFNTAPKKFVDKYSKETTYILNNLNRTLSKSHMSLINDIQFILKQYENL